MFRAPIWMTSAYRAHEVDVPRVHQLRGHGKPGTVAWLREVFNPSSPNPGKAYGECCVGLNAPPRQERGPPRRRRRSPTRIIMSRPSTAQGPGEQGEGLPPIVFPFTVITVSSFLEFPADELERAEDPQHPSRRPASPSNVRVQVPLVAIGPDDVLLHPGARCARSAPSP